MLALGGRNPVGYYKDPDKSSTTFKEIDGIRYSVPGDFATVDADGAIQLLGRGSVVINTGGEKVFPEEVEEVLKLHPAVADAVAVGIPDERFGQVVAAVVELRPRRRRPRPSSSSTSAATWPRSRPPSACTSWRPSDAPRPARWTTPATAPRPPSGPRPLNADSNAPRTTAPERQSPERQTP